MALTKCFVILFLVYLNSDILPLDSAAIPEKPDSSDNINENSENSELYTTTGATEEDIGKIFEAYENQYIKTLFGDDELTTNANNEKSSESQAGDETTVSDLETTEPTADDVVESIHNIMDEKIDTKKNRTDRTIVVVVTTNVFNINGSDAANKRQHLLLSFGTPGMVQKEPSSDATVTMHNQITSAFFNSITEQPETLEASGKKSIAEGNKDIDLSDSVGDSISIPLATEEKNAPDGSATQQSEVDNEREYKIDIRRIGESAGIESAILSKSPEGRTIDDKLENEDSNDILKIIKIIPSTDVDESNLTGSLSKPFEIPVQDPQDSSLMEAIETILDTDVRKAFERDIPQTHHVPLDINIEEEAMYAPLKDLSEYIVEEVPASENFEMFTANEKTDDKEDRKAVENVEVENFGKIEKSSDHTNYNRKSDPISDSDNLTDVPASEIEQKTTTVTTEEPTIVSITEEATPTTFKIRDDKETKTTSTKAALLIETTTTKVSKDEGTNRFTDDPPSNSANEHTDGVHEEEESFVPTTRTHYTFEAPITDSTIVVENEEDPERMNTLPVLSEHAELNNGGTESTTENKSDVHDKLPEENLPVTVSDGESIAAGSPGKLFPDFIEFPGLALLRPVTATFADGSNFDQLVDDPFDDYPTHVQFDITTEYITNPNLYIGAQFSGPQLAAILREAERARTASKVVVMSPAVYDVHYSTEENYVDTAKSFMDTVPFQGDVSPLSDLKDALNEFEHTSGEGEDTSAEPKDTSEEPKEEPEEHKDSSKDQKDTSEEPKDEPEQPKDKSEEHKDASGDQKDTSEEPKDKPEEPKNKPEEPEVEPEEVYQFQPRLLVDTDEVDQAENLIKLIERLVSTTTKPHGEDVVSEVVKLDEETTEQHQIIKKPGVHRTTMVELKSINITNADSNHLVESETTNFESRSFGNTNDDPANPLRTLVEAVELTADITKAVDNFQSAIRANDSIHLAANQIIEINDDMELVESAERLKVAEASSVWMGTAACIYVAVGVLSIGLTVLLGVVSFLRFRQFKRNILFSC